jgi:uncharacterized protein with HEPN domain
VVHGYLGVNLDIVWDVFERDLPTLVRVQLALRHDQEWPGRVLDLGR